MTMTLSLNFDSTAVATTNLIVSLHWGADDDVCNKRCAAGRGNDIQPSVAVEEAWASVPFLETARGSQHLGEGLCHSDPRLFISLFNSVTQHQSDDQTTATVQKPPPMRSYSALEHTRYRARRIPGSAKRWF